MHNVLQTWLDELSEEVVIDHATDVGIQGLANMVTIGVGDSSLKNWGKESLKAFILGCRDLYHEKAEEQPMLFYSWYDEQAGQLRFSSIASAHKSPPFECELEYVELDCLVDHIFKDNSGLLTKDAKLYVWTSLLE